MVDKGFSMMCKVAFGKYGYVVPVVLISGLVAGWFVFQAWLAADLTVVSTVESLLMQEKEEVSF